MPDDETVHGRLPDGSLCRLEPVSPPKVEPQAADYGTTPPLSPEAHLRWLDRLCDPKSSLALKGLAIFTLKEDRDYLVTRLRRLGFKP